MATTTSPRRNTAPPQVPMDSLRKTAFWAGVLYLISFVSIPTLILYGPVKEAGYIAGAGPDTGVLIGGVLELIVGLAGIGTAVVLYKVLRGRTKQPRWVSSALESSKAPSSSPASPAS